MTHFVYIVKWHIGNVFNKLPRQNAPTDRVLTSVILKGIEWAFRKVYPTKIPGMVHQGLLAPQSLYAHIGGKLFVILLEPDSMQNIKISILLQITNYMYLRKYRIYIVPKFFCRTNFRKRGESCIFKSDECSINLQHQHDQVKNSFFVLI